MKQSTENCYYVVLTSSQIQTISAWAGWANGFQCDNTRDPTEIPRTIARRKHTFDQSINPSINTFPQSIFHKELILFKFYPVFLVYLHFQV